MCDGEDIVQDLAKDLGAETVRDNLFNARMSVMIVCGCFVKKVLMNNHIFARKMCTQTSSS